MTEPPTPSVTRITDLRARLDQDGWTNIVKALDDGTVDKLSDFERATIDSALFGFGVLIAGKRMDPLSLRLLSYGPAPKQNPPIGEMETEGQR